MNTALRPKRVLSLWLPLLVIFTVSYSDALDMPDNIAEMDEKARQIDKLLTNETKKALLTGTDGAGTLSAFSHEGQIRHLKITVGMSNRKIEENFYYENGRLILATSRQSFFLWDEQMQKLDTLKSAMGIEDRYYFVDGKLRQWNTNRSAVDLINQDSNFTQKEETMLQQASFFMQTARSDMDKVDVEMFIKRGMP